MTPPPLVLASASPRRRQMLASLGLECTLEAPAVDETPLPGEAPADLVTRLALAKAQAVQRGHPDAVVLAADTSVVVDGLILGKPEDTEDAGRMLRALSGREHEVVTGVALASARETHTRVVRTRVRFRVLTDAQIAWYLETREPLDKAGAYGLQGRAGWFVASIDGSYSNVIGLPLAETLELLEQSGVALPW